MEAHEAHELLKGGPADLVYSWKAGHPHDSIGVHNATPVEALRYVNGYVEITTPRCSGMYGHKDTVLVHCENLAHVTGRIIRDPQELKALKPGDRLLDHASRSNHPLEVENVGGTCVYMIRGKVRFRYVTAASAWKGPCCLEVIECT
jgi:hypothetical protein